jgi:hypothetical protein
LSIRDLLVAVIEPVDEFLVGRYGFFEPDFGG